MVQLLDVPSRKRKGKGSRGESGHEPDFRQLADDLIVPGSKPESLEEFVDEPTLGGDSYDSTVEPTQQNLSLDSATQTPMHLFAQESTFQESTFGEERTMDDQTVTHFSGKMHGERQQTTTEMAAMRRSSAQRPELDKAFVRAVPERFRSLLKDAPEKFGPFRLFGRLPAGGMADVRLAYEVGPDGKFLRPCVVKRPSPMRDTTTHRTMFFDELRISRMLVHPHIVKAYRTGEIDGTPYISSELVDGPNGRELMRFAEKGMLPPEVVLDLGAQIAEALQYAHQLCGPDGNSLELIHRDVSPENILIAREGVAKLTDFGIARYEGRDSKTQVGVAKGKVSYMAPEQFSLGHLDGRTDIFALGVVLIELLTCQTLIENSFVGVYAIQDLNALVRSRLAACPVPRVLVDLLTRMLEIEPSKRPSSAQVVIDALHMVMKSMNPENTLYRWVRKRFVENDESETRPQIDTSETQDIFEAETYLPPNRDPQHRP